MIVCTNCTTQNRDGAKRCRQCGQMLPMGTPPYPPLPPQPGYPPVVPPVPPAPPPQSGLSWFKNAQPKVVGLSCLLLLVGFLFGIIGTWVVQTVVGANATPTPSVAEKPEPGSRPPTLKLKATDDKDVDFPKTLESKAGVLVFWAIDSKNDDQMAKLNALAGDKLKVFAVDFKDTAATARKYADGKSWSKITILLDGNEKAKESFKIGDLPVYFLIGKDGIITDKLANVKLDELETKVNDLIK